MKILTRLYPPHEKRGFVYWEAFYESDERLGARGIGLTQESAIENLVEYFPDDGAKVLP